MSGIVHLNRPSNEILLDLINVQSHSPLVVDQLTYDSPISINPVSMPLINRNTKLTVRGVVAEGTSGQKVVYYNRLSISILFGTDEVGVQSDFSDLAQAITVLNQTYGLAITEAEVKPAVVENDGSIFIEIANSLVYQPNTRIKLIPNGDLVWFENAVDRYWFYLNYTLPTAVN